MMKKILGYILLGLSAFGLGSLFQEIKIRRLKKKLSAIGTKKEILMETEARMRQILATKEKDDEIQKYEQLANSINEIAIGDNYEVHLNCVLTEFMDNNNIPKPWGERDFGEFMRDPNAKLNFN